MQRDGEKHREGHTHTDRGRVRQRETEHNAERDTQRDRVGQR